MSRRTYTARVQRRGATFSHLPVGEQAPAVGSRRPDRGSDHAVAPGVRYSFGQIPVQHAAPRTAQAKLTINRPGDQYEQEADRVAAQVMRMPEPQVQRQATDEAALPPELLDTADTDQLQRQTEEEEVPDELATAVPEEEVMTSPVSGQVPQATPGFSQQVKTLQGGGQPLAESTRAFMEPRFGHDFSQVRVHTDAHAAETARAVNARAFTLGRDVVFGPGQYAPDTAAGRQLLAHELTHVVQQRGGD